MTNNSEMGITPDAERALRALAKPRELEELTRMAVRNAIIDRDSSVVTVSDVKLARAAKDCLDQIHGRVMVPKRTETYVLRSVPAGLPRDMDCVVFVDYGGPSARIPFSRDVKLEEVLAIATHFAKFVSAHTGKYYKVDHVSFEYLQFGWHYVQTGNGLTTEHGEKVPNYRVYIVPADSDRHSSEHTKGAKQIVWVDTGHDFGKHDNGTLEAWVKSLVETD